MWRGPWFAVLQYQRYHARRRDPSHLSAQIVHVLSVLCVVLYMTVVVRRALCRRISRPVVKSPVLTVSCRSILFVYVLIMCIT